MKSDKTILITGTAGFIGFHFVNRLQNEGFKIIGIDNVNDYYELSLKENRLRETGIDPKNLREQQAHKSSKFDNYTFYKGDLRDTDFVMDVFAAEKPDYVVNLAAQAGVRYSLENPYAYTQSNVDGFLNILEGCRHNDVEHLIYASSSSVYGLNEGTPFSEHHGLAHPVSLYAATKKANELMGHTYSHLYGIPTTGLRFFTVYGTWGRPDMALFKFVKGISSGKTIDVYNNGKMQRDFTYIDDIVESMARLIPHKPAANKNWDPKNPDPATSPAPYRILNIGNNSPVKLMDFVKAIENSLNTKADINFMPLQPGDVVKTWADCSELEGITGYKPKKAIQEGVDSFVEWYKSYYKK